ncbi:HipA family kinase, partial [Aquiflexum sp.]|uniref:HipA family kinase n=1 Tax=Aquiflexum sp. TaxID=1872584 RepID=UPI00359386E5
MLEPIKRLNSIQVISETKTKGSSPLLVITDDDQDYYIKTSLYQPPKMELINEVLCAYFLKCWNILSPEVALIKIENEALEAYIKEKGPLSSRYKSIDFENEIFFGSKRINPQVEFDKHFKEL